MRTIAPVSGELSGRAAAAYGGSLDAAYQAMLSAEWQWRGARGGAYSLFQEMEDRDAHLFAALQTRKNCLTGRGWKVVAADDSPRAAAVAGFVESAIGALPDFEGALFQLLDAFAKGFSIAEVIWRAEGGGVTPAALKCRFQAAFAFDRAGALWLLEDPASGAASVPQGVGGVSAPDLLPRPGEAMVWAPRATRMPERKFLHFAFQGNLASPYGSPLCAKAYWYYWFKKSNLRQWAHYNDKFGHPTAVARYGPATSEDDLERLAEALSGLEGDTGLLVPEAVALELLEAKRPGGAGTYRDLADWCNDEMSKIVLGQTLTSTEGRRSGSLALGRVHERVRHEYLEADARAVAQAVSSQLVRWIVDFNFGAGEAAPRFVFDTANPSEFREELEVDERLVRLGVPLPARHFYDKYRRPAPGADDRALRFDDQNLYQYHLQYGVLTINEVRATLGLGPVAWGDATPAHGGGRCGAGSGAARGGRRGDGSGGRAARRAAGGPEEALRGRVVHGRPTRATAEEAGWKTVGFSNRTFVHIKKEAFDGRNDGPGGDGGFPRRRLRRARGVHGGRPRGDGARLCAGDARGAADRGSRAEWPGLRLGARAEERGRLAGGAGGRHPGGVPCGSARGGVQEAQRGTRAAASHDRQAVPARGVAAGRGVARGGGAGRGAICGCPGRRRCGARGVRGARGRPRTGSPPRLPADSRRFLRTRHAGWHGRPARASPTAPPPADAPADGRQFTGASLPGATTSPRSAPKSRNSAASHRTPAPTPSSRRFGARAHPSRPGTRRCFARWWRAPRAACFISGTSKWTRRHGWRASSQRGPCPFPWARRRRTPHRRPPPWRSASAPTRARRSFTAAPSR